MPTNPELNPETQTLAPLSYDDWVTIRRKYSWYDRGKLTIQELKSPLFCDVDEVVITYHSLRDASVSRSQADATRTVIERTVPVKLLDG